VVEDAEALVLEKADINVEGLLEDAGLDAGVKYNKQPFLLKYIIFIYIICFL